MLAMAYEAAGELDSAKRAYEEVLRQAPTHHQALSNLASLVARIGKKGDGVQRIRQQVKAVPKDVGLRLLLAKVLARLGDTGQAEAALREATAVAPTEPRLWIALARSQRGRTADEEALKTLRDAERKNPDSLAIGAELAAQLTRMGRGKAALPYYERVLRFATEEPALLNNAAMLYADAVGDGAKAVELAERAHQLAPQQVEVTDTLAWALYKRGSKGDLQRARRLLESISVLNSSATGKYHFGLVLIACGEKRRGRRLLREALDLTGEFPEAEHARKVLGE
jgi:Flp pilus assembly protein TadD